MAPLEQYNSESKKVTRVFYLISIFLILVLLLIFILNLNTCERILVISIMS